MTAATIGFGLVRKTPVASRPAPTQPVQARPRAVRLGLALTLSAALWVAIITVVMAVA